MLQGSPQNVTMLEKKINCDGHIAFNKLNNSENYKCSGKIFLPKTKVLHYYG